MADTAQKTEETQAETTETTQSTTEETQGKTFTQEQVNAMLADHKKRTEGKYADYDQMKEKASKFDELEREKMSEIERVTVERDELKTKADSAIDENTRLRVALEKKLPVELIDRLKGATKEELEADADELLKLVKPSNSGGSFDGGHRGSANSRDVSEENDPAKVLDFVRNLSKR